MMWCNASVTVRIGGWTLMPTEPDRNDRYAPCRFTGTPGRRRAPDGHWECNNLGCSTHADPLEWTWRTPRPEGRRVLTLVEAWPTILAHIDDLSES